MPYIAVRVSIIVIDIASRSATDSGGINNASHATYEFFKFTRVKKFLLKCLHLPMR